MRTPGRFLMTIIQHAVWLHHRFPLSVLARAAPMRTLGRYRDVQELLHQRGIQVSIVVNGLSL